MAGNLPHPRVLKNPQHTQLSYELPNRVLCAKAYPIKSPNGSTIVIYGHENGVKIVWRGGRPFKIPVEAPQAAKKANGTGNAVISLDSDDEGDAGGAFEDNPDFEDYEEEFDPAKPYPNILQTLDLFIGSDVQHLAILPAAILKANPSSPASESLQKKLFFAAACIDKSVRLITLSLTPPSPASKSRAGFRTDFTKEHAGQGSWGETVTVLQGHQKTSDGISVTAEVSTASKDLIRADGSPTPPTDPSFIVASHSREVTGRLLLWRISIKSPSGILEPFQSIYLSSPARSISFNPSQHKSHGSHLLVAEAIGACRIHDYKLLINNEPTDPAAAERGTWLLSLYPGFQSPKTDAQSTPRLGAYPGFGRTTIIDAKWVASGGAIIVFLADGNWGIWDIEGVGPGASQGLLGGQSVRGGSHTEFSFSGFIASTTKSRQSGLTQGPASKFAPMTPGTRKSTEPFGSRDSGARVAGQISVLEVPSTSPSSPPEDSVLFWIGDTFAIIPSLSKFWAAGGRKSGGSGNLFSGPSAARITKLENVELYGERCSGVEQIPRTATSTGLPTDILVLGEHRFSILSTGRSGREQPANRSSFASRLAPTEKNTNGGELDVVGIDQALSIMENTNGAKRKVLFQSR